MQNKVIIGLKYIRPLTVNDFISIKNAIIELLNNGIDIVKWRTETLAAMGKVPQKNEPTVQEIQNIVSSFTKTINDSTYVEMYATLVSLLPYIYTNYPTANLLNNLYLPTPIYEEEDSSGDTEIKESSKEKEILQDQDTKVQTMDDGPVYK